MHDGLLQVREYLEKHYQELSGMEAVKMAIKALTETVEAGSKNIEVCGMTSVPLPFSNSFFRASRLAKMDFVRSCVSSARTEHCQQTQTISFVLLSTSTHVLQRKGCCLHSASVSRLYCNLGLAQKPLPFRWRHDSVKTDNLIVMGHVM